MGGGFSNNNSVNQGMERRRTKDWGEETTKGEDATYENTQNDMSFFDIPANLANVEEECEQSSVVSSQVLSTKKRKSSSNKLSYSDRKTAFSDELLQDCFNRLTIILDCSATFSPLASGSEKAIDTTTAAAG